RCLSLGDAPCPACVTERGSHRPELAGLPASPSSMGWRRDRVHDGLGFLEVGDCERAAEPADPALPETALGEAVVDRRPGVRPHRPELDLATDAAADVDVVGEAAGGETH